MLVCRTYVIEKGEHGKEMGAKKARNKERFQEKLMSWRPALVNLAVHLWGAGMRRKSLIFKNTDSVSPHFFFQYTEMGAGEGTFKREGKQSL